jgi:lysophospholipase L1-like esterase
MTAPLRFRLALLATTLAGVAAGSGCGGDPAGTGPGNGVGPPELACPASLSLQGASAAGQMVTFANPVESGGTPPVTTSCSPASGSTFPVGTTTVGCAAKDAINRPAVCSFSVTVTSPPHLGAMSFVAFGDSQTAGENGIESVIPPGFFSGYTPACSIEPPPLATLAARRSLQTERPAYIDLGNSYPTQLLGLLTARFGTQAFTMDNEGFPGETAYQGSGRLVSGCPGNQSVFSRDHPDVLLLLEGINDIGGQYNYVPTQADEQMIYGYLKSDVAAAVAARVPFIFVSTILPVRECPTESPEQCRVGDYGDSTVPNLGNMHIGETNALILSGIPGAFIVDGNAQLRAADPTLVTLIGEDGLHPTPAGYAALAQAFMNGITAHIPVAALRRLHR